MRNVLITPCILPAAAKSILIRDLMSIYDTFIFFNELELLEIRLLELAPVVDYFVIVEACQTFTASPKPLYFADHQRRFSDFEDKIIHVVVDDFPQTTDPWVSEAHQRNAIIRGIANSVPDDVIMISDADEIPRRNVVRESARFGEPAMLHQECYYYWLNCKMRDQIWHSPRIVPARTLANSSAQDIRHTRYARIIGDAGWHFSYLGGVERIRQKIQSFSHQEYNSEKFLNHQWLADAINNPVDLFGRGLYYEFVPIDSSFPHAIIADPDRYKALVHTQGLPR
jgi:hypothetical protein